MHARRRFLQFSGAALASSLLAPALARAAAAVPAAPAAIANAADFAALEKVSGGRLGVTVLDTGSGRRIAGHRQDERFPMCSTFKSMLVAHVLSLADAGRVSLDTRVPIAEKDLLSYAPVARRHVGKDLSVRDLCRGTLTTSDNTAANLLLGVNGGPPALTAFLRAQGDAVTRNDRYEPEMNRFAKGDPRDTTSPAAMAASLARFAVGNGLSTASRLQFADWLIDNQTGDACLRAGLGKRWRVGDKTGSNGEDTRNDIAVLWPRAGGAPWVVTAYLQGASVDDDQRAAVLARVGALADAMIP
ncbi:L2 family class A beta-lactamase [Stenotrophomonas sp. ZAC14D1_NAIMI4_6]|uniref:L2 family extended-spectrum class A beta-lactamase n=1 Tax=unclassified Stenotrophomonas maltophilia group TaxID=2961925 RepID=UPI000D53ED9E|nr:MULTISPECIES: L2 family extended-spectrum class A beta-lactamase [unclassified Stenotrophomonas maltophilia group]AWH38221.1 L2 family class A beta-lactamase [Stenotrophomonas sp. ZAC14D1_NAIMI4_6]AWH42352.1 L2 family class A beta-lactamase [Stenotrophomonas sp. ZAC14D1_NAIMI4_1]